MRCWRIISPSLVQILLSPAIVFDCFRPEGALLGGGRSHRSGGLPEDGPFDRPVGRLGRLEVSESGRWMLRMRRMLDRLATGETTRFRRIDELLLGRPLVEDRAAVELSGVRLFGRFRPEWSRVVSAAHRHRRQMALLETRALRIGHFRCEVHRRCRPVVERREKLPQTLIQRRLLSVGRLCVVLLRPGPVISFRFSTSGAV
jgi:hypothetical protein